MESVGQLAAGVAHDFNNILTIIQGHSDLLLDKCQNDKPMSDPLQQVSDAAKRASTLTRQLLTFSRKQVMQSKIVDLNNVLGNMTKMLHRLLGEDVKLEATYGENMPCLFADPGMLEQIIMNLAVNARDAMPKGGQLLITTAPSQIDDQYVHQHADARSGDFICLSVKDTGNGMDEATLNRIVGATYVAAATGLAVVATI